MSNVDCQCKSKCKCKCKKKHVSKSTYNNVLVFLDSYQYPGSLATFSIQPRHCQIPTSWSVGNRQGTMEASWVPSAKTLHNPTVKRSFFSRPFLNNTAGQRVRGSKADSLEGGGTSTSLCCSLLNFCSSSNHGWDLLRVVKPFKSFSHSKFREKCQRKKTMKCGITIEVCPECMSNPQDQWTFQFTWHRSHRVFY